MACGRVVGEGASSLYATWVEGEEEGGGTGGGKGPEGAGKDWARLLASER